jgi:hypothetical protein
LRALRMAFQRSAFAFMPAGLFQPGSSRHGALEVPTGTNQRSKRNLWSESVLSHAARHTPRDTHDTVESGLQQNTIFINRSCNIDTNIHTPLSLASVSLLLVTLRLMLAAMRGPCCQTARPRSTGTPSNRLYPATELPNSAVAIQEWRALWTTQCGCRRRRRCRRCYRRAGRNISAVCNNVSAAASSSSSTRHGDRAAVWRHAAGARRALARSLYSGRTDAGVDRAAEGRSSGSSTVREAYDVTAVLRQSHTTTNTEQMNLADSVTWHDVRQRDKA